MVRGCEGKDELLLQLVHGQLPYWQAVRLQYHVARCPACRARLERYGALSSALARTLASSAGPRPLPSSAFKFVTIKGAVVMLALLAILLSLMSIRGSFAATTPSAASGSSRPMPHAGCSPAIQAGPIAK